MHMEMHPADPLVVALVLCTYVGGDTAQPHVFPSSKKPIRESGNNGAGMIGVAQEHPA